MIPEEIEKADAPPPLSARPQKFARLKERFLSFTSRKRQGADLSQAFLFSDFHPGRETFPRHKNQGQDSHLPSAAVGVKMQVSSVERSMRFPATIVILLLLLLQAAGVASSCDQSPPNSSPNACCSSRSQASSLLVNLPSFTADAMVAGTSSGFYAPSKEGSACCSGCRCDVQEQPAPADTQDPPCAPAPHARVAATPPSGATVAILPPPAPVHSRSSATEWACTTLFKSPFKRASLNLLHCAFLI